MNEKLRAIFDPSPDIVLVTEPLPGGDATIRYANPAFVRVSGYREDEVLGRSPAMLRGPRTDAGVYAALRSSRREGGPTDGETLFYRKDGVALRVQFSGHGFTDPDGRQLHITISRNVTEFERDLSARVRTLEALIDVAQTFLDRPQRAAADAIFRRALSTIAQFTAGVSVDERSARSEDPFDRRVIAGDPFVMLSENERCAFAAPRDGSHDNMVEIHIAHDIADLRDIVTIDLLLQLYRTVLRGIAVYGELEQRRDESARANQEKTDLLAMLAHDIRTPLTTIMGFADLMIEEPEHADAMTALEAISLGARTINQIADEGMMSVELDQNIFHPTVERIDLVPICNAAIAACKGQHPIVFRTNREVQELDVNAQSARAIVSNLIGNAVKYARGDTPVIVELKGDVDTLTLTVHDDGIGIPEDQLDFVFRAFARGRNARASRISGTGFGLHLVKRLVELHGGGVSVESTLNVGSTFVVRLPRIAASLPRAKRLIVIDPTEERGSFVVSMLRSRGFAITTVGDVSSALVAHRSEPTDLIIYDDSGHVDSAIGMLAANEVPYLILSARAEPLLLSSSHILAKPYLIDELYRAVAKSLDNVK